MFEVVTVTVPLLVFSIVMILNIHDESLVLGVSLCVSAELLRCAETQTSAPRIRKPKELDSKETPY